MINKKMKTVIFMSIKNEPKIKNPIIKAIREQLEHRALWMYLLTDEAQKKGLSANEYAPDAIRRCGLYQDKKDQDKKDQDKKDQDKKDQDKKDQNKDKNKDQDKKNQDNKDASG